MKQLLGMTALFPLGSIPLLNQLDEEEVPQAVRTALSKKYPDAKDTLWAADDDMQKFAASFENEDSFADIFFEKDGTWIETALEIDLDDVPEIVLDNAEKAYPEIEFFEAVVRVERAAQVLYEVVLRDEESEITLSYKPDGTLIEKSVTPLDELESDFDDDYDDEDFDEEEDEDEKEL